MQSQYCSLCPFSQVRGPYWNPDFEEEDYSVYCTKLKKIVYEDLLWAECASTTSRHIGLDVVGNFCPINKKENSKPE